MDRVCVVVLAASRARLFTFEPASRAGGADERFIEARDLMTTGPARADFSRFVVDQIVALARTTYARRLIICASPEVAGEFYDELDLLRIPIDVVEVDLVEVTRREIRQHLAARRLLP